MKGEEMQSLRKAAQQALKALESVEPWEVVDHDPFAAAITSLRAALAEDRSADAGKMVATIRPEVTVEPVAWISYESLGRLKNGGNSRGAVPVHTIQSHTAKIPLYTALPKRERLKEKEIDNLAQQDGFTAYKAPDWFVELSRAIELAHGIGE